MSAVRAAGLGLIVAFAATTALGAQAAVAATALPAAPAPAALTSAGAGTAAQTVTLPVPADGQVALLDPAGSPTGTLAVPGVGSYQLDAGTGVLTFRPAVGYVGAHGVLFRETDAFAQVGDGTYTPQVTLPAPPAATPLATTGTGTAIQTGIVAVPPDGNVVLVDGAGQATTSTVVPAAGEFRIDPVSGVVSFAPVLGYTGSPSIGLLTTDAYGQSATSAWTASVTAPDAPVAAALSSRAAGGIQQSAKVSVPVGAGLALVDAAGQPSSHVFLAGQGNYALEEATTTIVFTPAQGFFGVGSLTYELTDAYGQVSRNAYTPTVLAPVAVKPAVVVRPAVVVKPRKPPVAASQAAVLVPPIELVAAKPVVVHRVVHVATPQKAVRPGPVRASARPVRRPAPVAVQAKPPHTVTLVAPLAADPIAPVASSVSAVTHSSGRMAGLALIVVNVVVAVTALVLNRRRRST